MEAEGYYSQTGELKDKSPIFLACEIEDFILIEMMCDQG